MLKKFSVTNFKNFDHKVTFDLGNPANYSFNSEIIKNGIKTKGIFLGINGSGKSNFALALFDIILHLTDKERILEKYNPYLNLGSNKKVAEFEYLFVFDGIDVLYRYKKTGPLDLVSESLSINGNEVLKYDFGTKEGYVSLKGAENLQLSSKLTSETDKLSRVKVVRSNALLQDNIINRAFSSFMSFVDSMLMFYSLDERGYQGLSVGADRLSDGIVEAGKLKGLEEFLRKEGIDYNLVSSNTNGVQEIYCKFGKSMVNIFEIASTGTKSLILLYYWYIKMNKASLVFIDEYDAFYHFALSKNIVEMLKEITDVQIFLSTHNTDLISNDLLRPDVYFEISNNAINTFDKSTSKELRSAHNLQKMYKAGAFDGTPDKPSNGACNG